MLVDLHVHLRGTLLAELVTILAKRNDINDPGSVHWHDFGSFLKAYDEVTSVVRTATDLEKVAYSYLHRCATKGGAYVEFMLSPPDLTRIGVPFDDQVRALTAAAERAAEEWKIQSRLIATAVRHLGPDAAVQAARMATSIKTNVLVGFGLTGNENVHSAREFGEAFRIARNEGLLVTAHAGEHRPSETIIEAVETLGLNRVGHGVRAIESSKVVRQLANSYIPLEVCLSSNLALNLYSSVAEHPIRDLTKAGCAITLGTDDPGFFQTDIKREYQLATQACPSLTKEAISATAIEAAFCDDETKASLRNRLKSSFAF